MMSKSLSALAFTAGCVLALGAMPSANAQALDQTQVITNGPQASAGDYGEWSPRRNVIESRRYDRLLQTNMAFRAHRERRECGPITLPSLRERCLASFAQYEPTGGMTAGYGGGYVPAPSSSGAGYSDTYQSTGTGTIPYPPTAYPPNPASKGVGMTPGAGGAPQYQYNYR